MRSDYLILLLLLSTASVAMMYLGSQSDTTYVYDTASNLQKRFRTKLEQTMPACCKALTKECLSCAAGMLVKDFCDRHKGEYGCTNVTVTPAPVEDRPTTTPKPMVKEFRRNYRAKYIAQAKQDRYVDTLFKDKKLSKGLFVEFGGLKGDEYSNTWYFEKAYNWHGIMIEAEKKFIPHLKKVRPNCKIYNNAVCPTGVKEVTFASSKIAGWSGILNSYEDPRWHAQVGNTFEVKCVDLNTVLKENNFNHVDYMTVDTEGSEIEILETFQFHSFDITYIQVERNVKTQKQRERRDYLIQLMKKNGYITKKVFDIGNHAVDILFEKRKTVLSKIKKITDFVKCAGTTKPNWKKSNGFWIDLHPINIDQHVSGAFWRNKVWENSKYKFLKSKMDKNMVFVDIGANIGVFTLQALYDGYKVIAVEAFSTNIQKLCSSIVRNNFTNIELYQNALWDNTDGTLGFNTPAKNIGGNAVAFTNSGEQVHKMRIDTIISPLKKYVMKIDIEAAECRALSSTAFWKNPPMAITMEWGNLKNNKKLCSQKMYTALVRNISRIYGKNLENFKGWDAPNMVRGPSIINKEFSDTSYRYMSIVKHGTSYHFMESRLWHKLYSTVSKDKTSFTNFKRVENVWGTDLCLEHVAVLFSDNNKLYIIGGAASTVSPWRNGKYCKGHYIAEIDETHQLKHTPRLIVSNRMLDDFDSLPSIVKANGLFYLYTRENIKGKLSGKRGLRRYVLKSLQDNVEKYELIPLPFYCYFANIIYHDGLFHAFFSRYDGRIYKPYAHTKITYSISRDGINFTVVNENLFPNRKVHPVNGMIDGMVYFREWSKDILFSMPMSLLTNSHP